MLGSDIFCLSSNNVSKKVVVTDFDAVGGSLKQDYFYYYDRFESIPRIYGDNGDTVIDFGHHRTTTLLGVDRSDISMDDFKVPPAFDLI